MKHLLSITAIALCTLSIAFPVFAQDDVPPEATAETDSSCFVSTTEARTVRVRVGPGENRTSVTYLPENVDIPVLGETEDDDGYLWYLVDKDIAAPGRAINEAWVDAADLETSGNCDQIDDADAPPIIPIITQAAPSNDSSDETVDGEETFITDGGNPSDGNWNISWSSTSNVSCVGTDNVVVSTSEIFGSPGAGLLPRSAILFNITRPNAEAAFMFMFTPMFAQANGGYRGEITFFGDDGTFLPAVINIDSVSSNHMSGNMRVNGEECSGTVSFTANLG